MTKIKNFRLTLRSRDMARWLKKERGLETTPELEVAIEQAAKESKGAIETAALYTTLTRQVAEKTTPVEFPAKAIAVTVIAVSIGPALEIQRQSAAPESSAEALAAVIQQEALNQSLQFVTRLIQDQAKEEDCEAFSPISILDLPPGEQKSHIVSTLSTLLGTQRIGIALNEETAEIPPHVRVAWLFWTPAGKGSHSAGARKTPERAMAGKVPA